ncbi:hypothetical protein CFELI_02250 [Corynebacterium felinum]|nr:hypothetical protein CFELI_02250 [Corynebacterium felinum]
MCFQKAIDSVFHQTRRLCGCVTQVRKTRVLAFEEQLFLGDTIVAPHKVLTACVHWRLSWPPHVIFRVAFRVLRRVVAENLKPPAWQVCCHKHSLASAKDEPDSFTAVWCVPHPWWCAQAQRGAGGSEGSVTPLWLFFTFPFVSPTFNEGYGSKSGLFSHVNGVYPRRFQGKWDLMKIPPASCLILCSRRWIRRRFSCDFGW